MTHGCRMKLPNAKLTLITLLSQKDFLQSWNATVLDSDARKTLCGQVWLVNYVDSLSEYEKSNIQFLSSYSVYRFRDDKTFNAMKKTQLPVNIGSHQVMIETDIIDSDIPVLLSQVPMKQNNMNLNFKKDTISLIGETIRLTKCGQYAIPLTFPCRIVHNSNNKNANITL